MLMPDRNALFLALAIEQVLLPGATSRLSGCRSTDPVPQLDTPSHYDPGPRP
jgi:hypothetical protein